MVANWFMPYAKLLPLLLFVALLLIIGVVCFCINGPSDVVRLIIAQFLVITGVRIANNLVPMLLSAPIGGNQNICYFYLKLTNAPLRVHHRWLSVYIYILNFPYTPNNRNYLAVIALLLYCTAAQKGTFYIAPPKGSHQPSDLSAQNLVVALLAFFIPFYVILWFSWEFTGKCNLWRLRPDS